jgi:hypothetical protein
LFSLDQTLSGNNNSVSVLNNLFGGNKNNENKLSDSRLNLS